MFAACLEFLAQIRDRRALVRLLKHLNDVLGNCVDIGPHLAEQLAVDDHAFECDLEGSDAGHHLVAVHIIVVVRNQLAVGVVHRPLFRHRVVACLNLHSRDLTNGLSHYITLKRFSVHLHAWAKPEYLASTCLVWT